MSHGFHVKPEIAYGAGALERLKAYAPKKVCIVTDKAMVDLGVLRRVTAMLDCRVTAYRVFDKVEPDPSLATVKEGLHHILETKPDLLIAVGGGSVMDAAKAIIFFCIRYKEEVTKPAVIRKPYFIAVPTTSGTGSEVTGYAVVTDTAAGVKIPLRDALMLPDLAILDPVMTASLPKKVAADSGMDVLTHAVEAYVSRNAQPFSAPYALEAVKLTYRHLVPMVKNMVEERHRDRMLMASTMAGVAFDNSGLGLTHGMAHALGARFGLAHGRANAILLPHVVAYNSGLLTGGGDNLCAWRYGEIARALGFPGNTLEEGVKSLLFIIHGLQESLDIPATLEKAGVEETAFHKALPDLVKDAQADLCTGSNPVTPSAADILKVYLAAYYGFARLPREEG